MLREGPASEVMNRETKHDHLEGVSLLSAGLALGGQYVPAKVEVPEVGLGGAEGFAVFKHVPQLFANSLNIVTLFESASVITGGLAPQDVKG